MLSDVGTRQYRNARIFRRHSFRDQRRVIALDREPVPKPNECTCIYEDCWCTKCWKARRNGEESER